MINGRAILLGPVVETVAVVCHGVFHEACAMSTESDDFSPRTHGEPALRAYYGCVGDGSQMQRGWC